MSFLSVTPCSLSLCSGLYVTDIRIDADCCPGLLYYYYLLKREIYPERGSMNSRDSESPKSSKEKVPSARDSEDPINLLLCTVIISFSIFKSKEYNSNLCENLAIR